MRAIFPKFDFLDFTTSGGVISQSFQCYNITALDHVVSRVVTCCHVVSRGVTCCHLLSHDPLSCRSLYVHFSKFQELQKTTIMSRVPFNERSIKATKS